MSMEGRGHTGMAPWPAPVAFVLSGGASLGAAQVGMLAALADDGRRPDLLIGTSVGAMNAATYAADPADGLRRLARTWGAIRGEHVFPIRPMWLARAVTSGGSLVPPSGVERLIRAQLGMVRFEELPTPLRVVATDQIDGSSVVLQDGQVADAVRASIAIPGVFPAVRVAGRHLVDGGVSANVPILQAVEAGARTVVVLEASGPCRLTRPPRGVVEPLLAALQMLTRSQAEAQTGHAVAAALVIYLPTPCTSRTSPLDFSGSADLMSAAAEGTRAFLEGLRDPLPTRGLVGQPHRHRSALLETWGI